MPRCFIIIKSVVPFFYRHLESLKAKAIAAASNLLCGAVYFIAVITAPTWACRSDSSNAVGPPRNPCEPNADQPKCMEGAAQMRIAL